MYKSPIEQAITSMENAIKMNYENGVLKAVQSVGFNVDKEELAKALAYDRGQYEKGYEDARTEYESRWIPCSEVLPRFNEDVLVYRPRMGMKILVDEYCGYWGEDDDEWYEGWAYSGEEAVAWMPLPDPYKGE